MKSVEAQSVEAAAIVDDADSSSADGDTEGASSNGKRQEGKFGWMGSWTKKTFESAVKAQDKLGEMLARPARRYKELSEENAQLRRRAAELWAEMRREGLAIRGVPVIGESLVVKAGYTVVGVEADRKLLSAKWFRSRGKQWDEIDGAVHGVYRCTFSDEGCRLKVEIVPSSMMLQQCGSSSERALARSSGSALSLASASSSEEARYDSSVEVESKHNAPASTGPQLWGDLTATTKSPVVVSDLVKSRVDELTHLGSTKFRNMTRQDAPQEPLCVECAVDSDLCSISFRGSSDVAVRLPGDRIRILADGNNGNGLRIFINAESNCLHVFAENPVERDVFAAYLTWLTLKYPTCAAPAGISVEECAYAAVWDMLGYEGLGREKSRLPMHGPSDLTTPIKSFVSKNRAVFSSIFSTAVDPLKEVKADPEGGPTSPNRKLVAPENNLEFYDPLDERVEFDLYECGGFGEEFTVDLDLKAGEGLGMTLSLFSMVESPGAALPKAGASCICVTGFCPIVSEAGMQEIGQLQRCGRVRAGDALVAVSGIPVESSRVRTRRDLLTYEPCSLNRVASLVNRVRYGKQPEGSLDSSSAEPNSGAYSISFTFRQAGTGHGNLVASYNRTKKELEQARLELEDREEKVKTLVEKYERRVEEDGEHIRKLCEVVEAERAACEHAALERNSICEEVAYLKDRITTLQGQALDAQRYYERMEAENSSLVLKLQEEKEACMMRIAKLEASMSSMANEGEAWINTIGTKEDAMRSMESEMVGYRIKIDNLENLIDAFSKEASEFRGQLAEKDEEIEKLRKSLQSYRVSVDAAQDEADSLTSKLRLEIEKHENDLGKLSHRITELEEENIELRQQLSLSQTHCQSLVEGSAEIERQLESARAEKFVLESKLREEQTSAIANAKAVAKLEGMVAGNEDSSGGHYRIKELEQKRLMLSRVESDNADLKGQVKSLKSRLQSLSSELARLSQLDDTIAEKNELVVQLQLERASRLESEDELRAYKRALRQFAEQSKKEDSEGSGDNWSRRPKIFDHLYKRLLSEDKQNGPPKR